VKWVKLAQDMTVLRAVVKKVRNLRVAERRVISSSAKLLLSPQGVY
jgi:hypothetical protein